MKSSVLSLLALAFSGLLLLASHSFCEEISPREVLFVNNKIGSDDFDGHSSQLGANKVGPFATIMKAVRDCKVGAKIEIANTGSDYRESVSITGYKKGRAGTPLCIDGHGAYVSGLVSIRRDQWIHLKDDIYYFLNKKGETEGQATYGPLLANHVLISQKHQGWFTEKEAPEIFFVNGKPGPNALSLQDIVPGGFFFDSQGTTLAEPAGKRCLYFRLPENKKLEECVVDMPLNSGIGLNDDYVTVCNLGSKYSLDDGFQGFSAQGVVLRNIHACHNADQGISFHETSSTLIDGAVIEGNGNCGIMDIHSCDTIYRNVTVQNNFPYGILFRGFAHAMYNSRIIDNVDRQIVVDFGASASFKNCLIGAVNRKDSREALEIALGRFDHCTIVNSRIGIATSVSVTITDSIIADCDTNFKIQSKNLAPGYNFDIKNTIVGPGEFMVDGKNLDTAGLADLKKRYPTAIFDALALEKPLFGLAKDSPYSKAGARGTALGAKLAPFKEWTGYSEAD